MYAQSHRSNGSQSNLSLPMDEPFTPPAQRNPHRLSMPVGSIVPVVPGGAIVDSPTHRHRPRSRSPLRHSESFDGQGSVDGSPLPPDDDPWGRQPPLNSAAKFATNLAQRMGSLISAPRSPSLRPSDAELEAEAASERDRSRREAERILSREAEERRRIEQGVDGVQATLPPPLSPGGNRRGRSPSPNPKDGGWWKKLAPGKDKEPPQQFTPAQQIIEETKTRDVEVTRERSGTLSTPSFPPMAMGQRPALTPGGSPARDVPPLYAQFRPDGVLDVPGTLMTIARRFEKLERWTVGHVRALEERMNDVEKWLVDKERDRDYQIKDDLGSGDPSTLFQQAAVAKDVEELKDDLCELKGRITEIGKEMVMLRRDTASRPLPTPGPARSSALAPAPAPASAPTPAPVSAPAPAYNPPAAITSPVLVSTALNSAFSSGSIDSTSSRTRGNYPVGDYKSNSPSFASPPTSPSARSPQLLPATQALRTPSPLLPSNDRAISPMSTPRPSSGLPAPAAHRQPSVSPPRKRYTVALGGGSISQQREQFQTAYFSDAPSEEPASGDNTKDDDDESDREGSGLVRRDSKIGSTAIDLSRLSLSPQLGPEPINISPSPQAGRPRPRPQSAVFGPGTSNPTPSYRERTHSTAASSNDASSHLKHKRSQSIEPSVGLGLDSPVPVKFVDPLVIRRKDSNNLMSPKQKSAKGGKLDVGKLVAFFDGGEGKA
ncbi:hypothetical protein BKA62DRAFT_685346 [Auriculariales sp. MPI-PUGE-AT-0066]|nr:hypothetical protein BKA62DRAFT_685346 [Auriculariales sp. MPI-PUGE-AT-0066]